MRLFVPLLALLWLSACNRLPEGQGDGGITHSDTQALNEAAAALDAQAKTPRIQPGEIDTPKPPPL
jgi:hypothetical protein